MIKTIFSYAVIILAMLVSCSKNDNGNPDSGGSDFNPKDFQITNIHAHMGQGGSENPRVLYIDYTIKNVSSRDYKGYLYVKWKVKGADGAYYEGTDEPGILNAGASSEEHYSNLDMGSPSNSADVSTLTYTITDED